MATVDTIGMASIVIAGMTTAIGSIGLAIGKGWALSRALAAIAQQPDEANTLTRTLCRRGNDGVVYANQRNSMKYIV